MIVNGKSTAATYKGAETDIFNKNLQNLTVKKNQLIDVYTQVLKNTELNLQRLKGTDHAFTINRLNAMQDQVKKDLAKLNQTNRRLITSGYVQNFETAYYGTGYEFERYTNVQLIKNVKTNINLGYYQIDRNYILASLNESIAAETFSQRMTENIVKLRGELRRAFGIAAVQGDSAITTALNIQKGIDGIGKAMTKSVNSALRIARTEMLKAYSMAHEIASNQAEAAGVELRPTWNSTLDGKTRVTHQTADKKKFILDANAQWMLTVGGVVFSSPRIVLYSSGGDVRKEVIQCRCRRNSNPFGFEANTRVARLSKPNKDGQTWETINGDKNYKQWSESLEGKKEINKTIADRAARAKELRLMRIAKSEKREFTKDEKELLAQLRKQYKGRLIGNVGTRTKTA